MMLITINQAASLLTYRHNTNFIGENRFTFKVNDGRKTATILL